jgi:hypothetical protein
MVYGFFEKHPHLNRSFMNNKTYRFQKPILAIFLFLLSYNQHFAQNILDSISTNSPSCNMVLAACEGDTIALVPQNRPNYTNYRWYRNTVSTATEITAANATANNVVATNFNSRFPTLFVISTGGMYILTSQYSSGANCITLNDTFSINYAQRPVVQVTVTNPTICVGGSRTLNANLLAGSGICTFQWQRSTDGVTWFNIGGETANFFTTPPLSTSTRYRVQVYCSNNICCESGTP